MILHNEICHIEINIDETYTVDSVDNRHYDVILNPGHYQHNDLSKTLSIHIGLYAREFQVALIGAYQLFRKGSKFTGRIEQKSAAREVSYDGK